MHFETQTHPPTGQAVRRAQGSKGPQSPGWMVGYFEALGDPSILRALAEGSTLSGAAGLGRRVELAGRRIVGRRRLRDQVEALVRCENVPSVAQTHPGGHPDFAEYADSWRRVRLVKQFGSHWTLAVSLEPVAGHLPLPAVHHLLTCASAAMLIQLATGAQDPELALPLRGAIAIARDVTQEKDIQRSSGLHRAQQLEQERAIFPRALICENLARQLSSLDRPPLDHPVGVYAAQLERVLPGLWFEDEDGETVLDFLSPVVRDAMEDGSGKCHALAYNAWSHVTQRLRSTTVPSVRAKYEWLASYMRPRLWAWGVSA